MVDIETTLQVVTLVLNYAGQKAGNLLFVGLEIFIDPCEAYVLDTGHIFRQAGQAQTSLRAGDGLALEYLDLGVDEHKLTSLAFGERILDRVGVNHDYTLGKTHLRAGKAYAFAGIHGGKHVVDKFLEPFARRLYVGTLAA